MLDWREWFVAYLFAVLVGDNVSLSGTRISTQDDSVLEETANDGGPSASCLGKGDSAIREEIVSVQRLRGHCLTRSGRRMT